MRVRVYRSKVTRQGGLRTLLSQHNTSLADPMREEECPWSRCEDHKCPEIWTRQDHHREPYGLSATKLWTVSTSFTQWFWDQFNVQIVRTSVVKSIIQNETENFGLKINVDRSKTYWVEKVSHPLCNNERQHDWNAKGDVSGAFDNDHS